MGFAAEIGSSIAYLKSDVALEALHANAYWPKWQSPWWHMLLLHEMGETTLIPEIAIQALIDAVNAIPIKIFPIHEDEFPAGADPYRDTACHCQLGNVYRVLDGWGIDVDEELPWITPWFIRYRHHRRVRGAHPSHPPPLDQRRREFR